MHTVLVNLGVIWATVTALAYEFEGFVGLKKGLDGHWRWAITEELKEPKAIAVCQRKAMYAANKSSPVRRATTVSSTRNKSDSSQG